MTEQYRQFVELLQIALGKRVCMTHSPSPEDWHWLYEQAQKHTILGPLYGALNRLPAAQRPDRKLVMNWHSSTEKVRHDNKRMDHHTVWTHQRFLKAGFRNCILKGQTNAQLYPDSSLRQSGDVDVWLDADRTSIIRYVLKLFPHVPVQWIEMEFPIRRDCVIEVHSLPGFMSCPMDNARLSTYFMDHREEVMTHTVTLPGEGDVCTPTTRVNLVFQLTHIYRHVFNEGIGLRQLMDYYYLLHSPDARDHLMETERMVRRLHMECFCAALMWVLQEVFLLEDDLLIGKPDGKVGAFLLNEILLAGNFGKHDSRNKHRVSKWGNFWQKTLRNMRFLRYFPREVIWNPYYRLAQFVWRCYHGYR